MADFFQNGVIATLHDLRSRDADHRRADLARWTADHPVSLVIPSLFSEVMGEALPHIVDELSKVEYLTEVIIGLDRADAGQFRTARTFFDRLPQRHRIVWNDGPGMTALASELESKALAPTSPGKGRNVWYSLGYFLASGRGHSVALHDADIVTYDRTMLDRLIYPIVHPTFDYVLAKGYYYRADKHRLNGRVSRLLVSPVLRSLRGFGLDEHAAAYLDYLDSFRYPLAGEHAMGADVVRSLRVAGDWGFEIGVLSEAYRNFTTRRICQVELCDAYDHKHQDLSASDPAGGLHKMARDIVKALFRKLAEHGVAFTPAKIRALESAYHREALDLIDRYHDDALMNGFSFHRDDEEDIVGVFAAAILEAGDEFLENPTVNSLVPSWNRVQTAMPDVFDRISKIVDDDNS